MGVIINIKNDTVSVSGGGLNRVSFSKSNALSMNKTEFKDAFAPSLHGHVDSVWSKIGGKINKKAEKKSDKESDKE